MKYIYTSPCVLVIMLTFLRPVYMHKTLCTSPLEYGVVIDVGSSGSRVRVYRWPLRTSQNEIPQVAEIYTYKKKPGFSSLPGDLDVVRLYITDLLDHAKAHVPEEVHANSAIYFLATAGMRLLLEEEANMKMDAADEIFSDVTLNPFQYDSLHTRILSGEEEGAFAWIALNYLRGYFTGDKPHHAGVMELGGASTQIAFVPDVSPLAGKFPVRVGGVEYPLYVHSYLYYGQEFSFLWSVEYLANMNPGLTSINHPCMLTGDTKTRVVNGTEIELHGISDPVGCRAIIEQFVYQVEPLRCHPKPCAIGPFYQPSIPDSMTFFAMSAFNYPIDAYGIDNGIVQPIEILQGANEYCTMSLSEAAVRVDQAVQFLSANCQDGIYAAVLFTKAYGFEYDSDDIHIASEIDGHDVNWAIGSIIYEASDHPVTCGTSSHLQHFGDRTVLIATLICFILNVVVIST